MCCNPFSRAQLSEVVVSHWRLLSSSLTFVAMAAYTPGNSGLLSSYLVGSLKAGCSALKISVPVGAPPKSVGISIMNITSTKSFLSCLVSVVESSSAKGHTCVLSVLDFCAIRVRWDVPEGGACIARSILGCRCVSETAAV